MSPNSKASQTYPSIDLTSPITLFPDHLAKMPIPSIRLLSFLSCSLLRHQTSSVSRLHLPIPHPTISSQAPFSTHSSLQATLNQVKRGCRVEQRARHKVSPQMRDRPQMKAVCLKVGTVKPKKPNSAERKVARVKLSNGIPVTAYIPGEGELGNRCKEVSLGISSED